MTVGATIPDGTARHGTARHGTARHGTARHNLSINQSKRSFSTLLCQPLFAQFFEKPRDRNIHGHRRTVPMNVTVFSVYPAGLDPGG